MKDINEYLLISNVTVGQLREWMSVINDFSKSKIINLINHRFKNRYLKHLPNIDSGFPKMAIACLMIETIQSFKEGILDTNGRGPEMFRKFFESEETLFPNLNRIYADFYKNIRCGILHQAETTNAWRILLFGELLDEKEKYINANKFVESLSKSLSQYITDLNSSDIESILWKNALLKLDDICNNCKVKF